MSFVKPTPDYEAFCRDVETTARIAGTPADMTLVREILQVYWDHCSAGWLSFRTTNKPDRELSVRYIDFTIPHDPFAMALEHGYLTQNGHPVYKLMTDMAAQYPMLGYGVDVGADYGIEKIWPFVRKPVPVDDLNSVPSMPASLRSYSDYFKKYNLKWTSLYAIDYRHKSMNIYFMFPEPRLSTDQVAHMISDLGFAVPSQEELEVNTRVGALYYTFTWDSPRCERVSYAVPHAPASQFPMHWDPIFARMMRETPTLLNEKCGCIMTAYTPDHGHYLKIEMDYSGQVYSMLEPIAALPH